MKYKLGERAEMIYKELENHCKEVAKIEAIFYLELSMLADSLATYFDAAEYCSENGTVFNMPTKTGVYPMLRPEYQVKKTEYANILKHGPKFGLNPSDFAKLAALKPEKSGKDELKTLMSKAS